MVDAGLTYPETTYVNPVQSQQRQQCGETARGRTSRQLKHLVHVQRVCKLMGGAVAPVPVVEITGNNQRRILGNQPFNTLA